MKVDRTLVAVEHAVRIFVLGNYFLHYAMLHKLEVLGSTQTLNVYTVIYAINIST